MSSIPNDAIPKAGAAAEAEAEKKGLVKRAASKAGDAAKSAGGGAAKAAGKVADLARNNPKTAIAAGAAVAAVAAAAVVRSRRNKAVSTSGAGKSGAKKKS